MMASLVRRITPHGYLLTSALRLRDGKHRLGEGIMRRLRAGERVTARDLARLERNGPERLMAVARERVEAVSAALREGMRHRMALTREVVERQDQLLAALSHRSVLSRGFSITRLKRGRALVRKAGEVTDGVRIVTEVHDGAFESMVVNQHQKELFD